jgi:hypothetical protein
VASLTDDAGGIIYDRKVFIIQATGRSGIFENYYALSKLFFLDIYDEAQVNLEGFRAKINFCVFELLVPRLFVENHFAD